jgi:SAM-dependent methyltransferase
MEASFVAEYEQFEEKHWWFVARRKIIHQFLNRYAPKGPATRWLDVGCGTGVLLDSYKAIQDKVGVETESLCVERGKSKGLNIHQTGLSWDFSSYGKFDLITLCDVIEHVEHDAEAIAAVKESLNPGGIILVTVPALMSLWSAHDVVNHHFRRYTKSQLRSLFSDGRWTVLRSSYFCSFLFPTVWLARKLKTRKHGLELENAKHDLKFGLKPVDATLQMIFSAEKPLLNFIDLPVGSSLILVAKKL